MKNQHSKFLTSIFFGIFFFFCNSLFSQDKFDLQQLEGIFELKQKKTGFKEHIKDNSNELDLLTSGLFLFYKSFFSSQDGNHCVFHPSCSEYAIQSIKKKGFLIGVADAMDRLSRCNKLSPENYNQFENSGLFYDPLWHAPKNE
jgi:putative membrane protein insertion efficiency factor